MNSSSVIVVGGGLAGLSSAIALAEAGCRVRLLEKRPHLGGRAASYTLPDGTEIDNCQHVTMGCCTNLDDFYGRAGAREKIRFFDRMAFADREGRISRMGPWPLPAPLHLGPSFARFRSLGVADKLAIARALGSIVRSGGRPTGATDLTMLEWLRRQRQTPAAIERFWRLVLVSALDEELDRAQAQYGIDVFWKGFLANRAGFRIGVPTVPLGELYAGCSQAIARRGGEIRTRARVSRFRIEDGRVAAIVFDDGSEETADAYVAAVPHDALLEMLPADLVEREPVFANLRQFRSSPITGIHFWFDRPVTEEPFLALVGLESQWIFNKSVLLGSRSAPSLHPEQNSHSRGAEKSRHPERNPAPIHRGEGSREALQDIRAAEKLCHPERGEGSQEALEDIRAAEKFCHPERSEGSREALQDIRATEKVCHPERSEGSRQLEETQYLQVVISASYDLVPRSRQEIIEMVRKELDLVLPAAREARLVKATVVKETAATFSPAPGVDRWRPESLSPIRQLFLAGDWTRTGWPATMEGAVRSGYLAAQAVLSFAGQHRVFLQPDLLPEGFVHIWVRS